jgi:predicted PolB exonuclease-like 3'-5' exonuclease
MRYILDIETCGLPDAKEFAEPVSAPGNYKDEAKIAAYVAEKQAEQVTKAGLDLDLCRIIAIGFLPEGGDVTVLTAFDSEASEAAMIEAFWAHLLKVQHPVLVGFNSNGFDLPVLMRRSQYLGIAYPRLSVDKYRSPHIDLMQHLTWNGLVRARSLKFYARRFNIPVDDTVSGADIAALVAAGEFDKVLAHVTSDVRLTAALADRLGLFQYQQETVTA